MFSEQLDATFLYAGIDLLQSDRLSGPHGTSDQGPYHHSRNAPPCYSPTAAFKLAARSAAPDLLLTAIPSPRVANIVLTTHKQAMKAATAAIPTAVTVATG